MMVKELRRALISEHDPSSDDRTHAEEHERLMLETRELLQHAIQSGLSYQSYLHKFCLHCRNGEWIIWLLMDLKPRMIHPAPALKT